MPIRLDPPAPQPQPAARDTYHLAGKLMRGVGSVRGGHAALSAPVFPRSRQPFSASGTTIAEPSRAVRDPGGLRNTEPPIAQSRGGGRRAWRARHSIAWSLIGAQPQFGETYPTAQTACALAHKQSSSRLQTGALYARESRPTAWTCLTRVNQSGCASD